MVTIQAREVLTECVTLLPGGTRLLINPLVHINADRHQDRVALADVLPPYAAGSVTEAPVILGRFPAPVRTDPPRFTFVTEACPIRFEPHDPVRDENEWRAVVAALSAPDAPMMRVEAPVLLAGRYGDFVWGHWLQQMLPKIVLAEALFPGHFLYAVSARLTAANGGAYAARVLESLAAYGIAPSRLLRLPPGHSIEFTNAYDILGLWQHGLVEGAQTLMRRIIADVAADPGLRVMTLRGPQDARALTNRADIAALLRRRGFYEAAPAALDFLAQARLFARAGMIAGELGSNMAGILYSPRGLRLLSFAPMGWMDSFFSSTVQHLRGFQADIRGASTLTGADRKNAAFTVDPEDAAHGLAALEAAADRPIALRVGGQDWPRDPGAPVLALRFQAGSGDLALLRGDWHPPEAGHCWAQSDQVGVAVPAERLPPGDYWVEWRGLTVSHRDYMPLRRATLSANGVPLLRGEGAGNLCLTARLPARVFTQGAPLVIGIDLPAVGRACDLGAAGDTRRLGVGISALRFYRGVW